MRTLRGPPTAAPRHEPSAGYSVIESFGERRGLRDCLSSLAGSTRNGRDTHDRDGHVTIGQDARATHGLEAHASRWASFARADSVGLGGLILPVGWCGGGMALDSRTAAQAIRGLQRDWRFGECRGFLVVVGECKFWRVRGCGPTLTRNVFLRHQHEKVFRIFLESDPVDRFDRQLHMEVAESTMTRPNKLDISNRGYDYPDPIAESDQLLLELDKESAEIRTILTNPYYLDLEDMSDYEEAKRLLDNNNLNDAYVVARRFQAAHPDWWRQDWLIYHTLLCTTGQDDPQARRQVLLATLDGIAKTIAGVLIPFGPKQPLNALKIERARALLNLGDEYYDEARDNDWNAEALERGLDCFGEARFELSRIPDIAPGVIPYTYAREALCWLRLGNPEESRKSLQLALRLNEILVPPLIESRPYMHDLQPILDIARKS